MKKTYTTTLFAAGMLAALLLSGCGQKASSDAQTEALKEQIASLEQKISELEQNAQGNQTSQDAAPAESAPAAPAESAPAAPTETAPPANPAPEQENPAPAQAENPGGEQKPASSELKTTDSLETLEALVAAFEEKAGSAAANGSDSENMEQFFILKQEEKQIDDKLDLHEDELEYLYRMQSLTREEYKRMERDLEYLEDRLDDAEDYLELVFGIDD